MNALVGGTSRVNFRHPDGASVWLSFSSSVCVRVQVGTRTVEEPIYEIQCEEPVTASDPEAQLTF